MKISFFKQIPLVLVITTLCGCATIVSKTSYPISVHTDPKGVNISITDRKGKEIYTGTSPATIDLKSGAGFFVKARYEIRLSSPGFTDKTVTIDYKLNNWYYGNIIFGGLIGLLIVDPATGAMWKIKDPVVDETMVRETSSGISKPVLHIINIDEVSKNMQAQLVRVN